MKIAYVHANFWPYVRRGVERFTYELAAYMARQGHEVDVITTKPGPARIGHYGPVRVIYQSQLRHPLTQRFRAGFLYNYLFGLTSLRPLLAGNYDIIHCWFYTYVLAAYLAQQGQRQRKKQGAGKIIYHNVLTNPHFAHPVDRWWFRWSLRKSAAVAVLSEIAAGEMRELHGVDAAVLPPPVNLNDFGLSNGKDLDAPQILYASSLTDPQKGLPWLLAAFRRIRQEYPKATLKLAGPEEWFRMPGELWQTLAANGAANGTGDGLQDAVQVLGVGTLNGLADLYREAAVTVLPSFREPFGMVLTESLAAGTPVVGTTGGGPEEIIVPSVGTIVPLATREEMRSEAKVEELAQAVMRSIELNREADIAQRCRARASLWGTEVIGAKTEAFYRGL